MHVYQRWLDLCVTSGTAMVYGVCVCVSEFYIFIIVPIIDFQ